MSQAGSRATSKPASKAASRTSITASTKTSKQNLAETSASRSVSRAGSQVALSQSARNSISKISTTGSRRNSRGNSKGPSTPIGEAISPIVDAPKSAPVENTDAVVPEATEAVQPASVDAPITTEAVETSVQENSQADQSQQAQDAPTEEATAPITEEVPPTVVEQEESLLSNVTFESTDEIDILESIADDAIAFVPVTARLLESPLPSQDDGFTFVNVDYAADPDTPVIQLATRISRSNSWDWGIERAAVSEEAELIRVVRPITPIMRPSTPIVVEQVAVESVELKLEPEIAALMPEATDDLDREAIIFEIRGLLDAKEKYIAKNLQYQNLLGEYFRRKRTDEARDGEKSVTDQEKRYMGCMQGLEELGKQYLHINSANERNVADFNIKLQERIDEAQTRAQEFSKYKRSVALSAENSRTGKPIPVKIVDQLEGTEQRKEAEVVAVRLENIKLRNKLKRDETLLRQKEELADGLHLIDFEQLKIENQTYNEKIEERNEDLLKLRKKITNVVQELTHVKEKLQFVENIDLKQELSSLDIKVANERDQLPATKRQRDLLRLSNVSLKHKNGLLGNVPLLRDFELKVEMLKEKTAKIDNLRDYHQILAAENLAIKRKIRKAQLLQ